MNKYKFYYFTYKSINIKYFEFDINNNHQKFDH